MTFKERWGFKTNAVDWLLTIPNVGVEFDLKDNVRNKHSLNFNLKWNWNTSHVYVPSTVFNIFDARVEWRQYFRTYSRGDNFTEKPDIITWLNENIFTVYRKNPRTNRAYYWGIYAQGANYSLKLGKTGRQGSAYGAGVSLGFTAPLYGYEKGYIDLEVGGAVGLMYNKYDTYGHDPESNDYPHIKKGKSGLLPMVTDLRVAFVYRFMSVGQKYQRSIYRRKQLRDERRQELNRKINARREQITSIADSINKLGVTSPDSILNTLLDKEQLKLWKQMQKEAAAEAEKLATEKLRRAVADSLGIQYSDTLDKKQQRQLDKAVELRQEMMKPDWAEKQAKRAEKEAAKAEKRAAKAAKKEEEKKKEEQEDEAATKEEEAVIKEEEVAE